MSLKFFSLLCLTYANCKPTTLKLGKKPENFSYMLKPSNKVNKNHKKNE